MPDITMCANHDCPMRKRCLRHESTPSEHWQSWAYFPSWPKCERLILMPEPPTRVTGPTFDFDERVSLAMPTSGSGQAGYRAEHTCRMDGSGVLGLTNIGDPTCAADEVSR